MKPISSTQILQKDPGLKRSDVTRPIAIDIGTKEDILTLRTGAEDIVKGLSCEGFLCGWF